MQKQNTRINPISNVRILFLTLAIGSTLFTTSCMEGGESVEKEIPTNDTITKSATIFEVEGKVFSIPSPIQTALLLKESGSAFNKDILNATSNVSKYTASTKKALNLGIYGADLGYVTIFEETQSSIAYLAVSKSLANDLGISNIFNESLLARYEKNISYKDSLLNLVSDAFRATDRFLKQNDQENLGALILAGGWIETLYLTTKITNIESNQKIINRIGEQKITIENLMKLLMSLNESAEVTLLLSQLNDLKDTFSQVEYSYTYIASTVDEANKTTTINSTSSTTINKETLGLITSKVNNIRNSIIQ